MPAPVHRLTVAAVGGTIAVATAAAYAAPSIARLAPPRLRLTPRLSGFGDRGHLALTFDDGPDARSTPAILDVLAQLGWRATFFVLGEMIAAHPETAREVVAAGHELGVHGWRHRGAIRRPPAAIVHDVVRCQEAVRGATGVDPRWYRPPFGELSLGSLAAARKSKMQLVLWTAWGHDWRAEATPGSVLADLRRGVLDGGTVLLHDSDCTSAPGSWRVTAASLPRLAELCDRQGLRVGPLGEHGLAA